MKLQLENLLLENTEYDINAKLPAQNNCSGKHYVLPLKQYIKLIDFGGATFKGEYKTKIINTRQYRAPEVITRNSRCEV
jgi:serine/threonine protein kinase